MKNFKLALIALASLLALSSTYADENNAGAIGTQYMLIPPIIDIDFTHSHFNNSIINIANNSNQTLKLGVSLIHYQVGSTGPYQDDKPLNVPANYNSDLTSYIHYSPQVLMIPPSQTRAVRLSVRLEQSLPPGDYWANVKFSMQSKPFVSGMGTSGPSNISIGIKFLLDQVGTIYGRVGTPTTDGIVVNCSMAKNNFLNLSIKNPTAWRFNAQYVLYQAGQAQAINQFLTTAMMPYSQGNRSVDMTKVVKVNNASYSITWQIPGGEVSKAISCQ